MMKMLMSVVILGSIIVVIMIAAIMAFAGHSIVFKCAMVIGCITVVRMLIVKFKRINGMHIVTHSERQYLKRMKRYISDGK